MATFSEHMAADVANIMSGEFAEAANWDGTDINVVRVYADIGDEDRGRHGVHDELDLLVSVDDVPALWYRQQVTFSGATWTVLRWRRDSHAAWRVTLRKEDRPVI